VVLRDGLIEQVGSPIEIYERPANEFIAGFVGYVNFMEGRVASIDEKTRDTVIHTEYGKIEITLEQENIVNGDEVLMVIRPESVNISLGRGGNGRNVLSGALKSYMYAGSLAKCTVMIGDRTMIIDQYNPRDAQKFKHAEKVEVEIPRSVHLLKKKK
jgi:iron(III) transport system ATP-binding protein